MGFSRQESWSGKPFPSPEDLPDPGIEPRSPALQAYSLLSELQERSDNEDNGDLPQKIPCMYCYTQCPQPCSRPQLTHASAGDSWTPTGKSGTVSCGVTAPFSWDLVHKFLLCPPRDYFPVPCKFWQLYGGVNGDLLQEGLFHIQVCCTQRPCPCGRPLLTVPPQETLKHSSVSVSVGSLVPGMHKVYLRPLSYWDYFL